MSSRETADTIADVASDWAAKLDRGLSRTEQETLELWLDGDARRVGALARARALWSHAETALADRAPTARHEIRRETRRPTLDRRGLLAGGGAALAAGVAGAAWLGGRARAIDSGIGEIRRIALEDGSSVTLGASTRILPRFGPSERLVKLIGGEAFFDITTDAARPFVVLAKGLRIRTDATAFGLRAIEGLPVSVLVERGGALVEGEGLSPIRMAANERLVLTPASSPRLDTLAPDAVQRGLAWRAGLLAFDNQPLAEVAASFHRYGPVRIQVDDPVLAREPVTGLFSASDPKGFARAIALSLNARAVISGDTVRLERS